MFKVPLESKTSPKTNEFYIINTSQMSVKAFVEVLTKLQRKGMNLIIIIKKTKRIAFHLNRMSVKSIMLKYFCLHLQLSDHFMGCLSHSGTSSNLMIWNQNSCFA